MCTYLVFEGLSFGLKTATVKKMVCVTSSSVARRRWDDGIIGESALWVLHRILGKGYSKHAEEKIGPKPKHVDDVSLRSFLG